MPIFSPPNSVDMVARNASGVGSVWTDKTASRASGVIYTNTTGRTIEVHVESSSSMVGAFAVGHISVDGLSWVGIGVFGQNDDNSISDYPSGGVFFRVFPLEKYRVYFSGDATNWAERS